MIIFPRKGGKQKSGDASAQDVKNARTGEGMLSSLRGSSLAIVNKPVVGEAKVSDEKSEEDAYKKLRIARSDARHVGKREKRRKAKEDEEAAKKK